jgi:hypothetical protein
MKFVEVTSEDILLIPLGYRFFPLGYDQKHLIFAIFKTISQATFRKI